MIYAYNKRKHFIETWDLSANTVTQYKCNDDAANTTVTDEEGTNGTSSTNTSNLSVVGKINDAFDFTSASSEYVDTNQAFQTTFRSDFSMSCWIKPDDGQPAGNQFILGVYDTSGEETVTLTLMTTGKIRVEYGTTFATTVTALTNAAVFSDGATSWTHALITIDSSNIKIYINSSETTLDGTSDGDMSGETMGNYTTTEALFLGAWSNGGTPSTYFDGVVDDFRIMDKVCTQAEINGLYNSGNGTEAQSG